MNLHSISHGETTNPAALILLLHGYGADGQDLMPVAVALSAWLPRCLFLLPDAPQSVPDFPQGRQWFPLRQPFDDKAIATDAQAHLPPLLEFARKACAKHAIDQRKCALFGFSQGAMMAIACGLAMNPPPAAIVSIAGRLVCPAYASSSPGAFFLAHGDADPVVPFSSLDRAVSSLRAAGHDVCAMREPGGGHSISARILHASGQFLKDHVRETKL